MYNTYFIQLTNRACPCGFAHTSQELCTPQIRETYGLGILGFSESFQPCILWFYGQRNKADVLHLSHLIGACQESVRKWMWRVLKITLSIHVYTCYYSYYSYNLGSFQEVGEGFKLDHHDDCTGMHCSRGPYPRKCYSLPRHCGFVDLWW